jgi:hypothetical protein
MKTKLNFPVLPAIILMLLAIVSCEKQSVTPDRQVNRADADPMPKFEYLVTYLEYGKDVERMNKLGQQGWELVAVHPLENGAKAHPFYFKRQLTTVQQTSSSNGG